MYSSHYRGTLATGLYLLGAVWARDSRTVSSPIVSTDAYLQLRTNLRIYLATRQRQKENAPHSLSSCCSYPINHLCYMLCNAPPLGDPITPATSDTCAPLGSTVMQPFGIMQRRVTFAMMTMTGLLLMLMSAHLIPPQSHLLSPMSFKTSSSLQPFNKPKPI